MYLLVSLTSTSEVPSSYIALAREHLFTRCVHHLWSAGRVFWKEALLRIILKAVLCLFDFYQQSSIYFQYGGEKKHVHTADSHNTEQLPTK